MRFTPALLFCVFPFLAAFAGTKDLSEYPLRVYIAQTQWNRNSYGATGFGHGNIEDGDETQGFDYTFDCSAPFNPSSGPNSTYMGRWKKEGTRLAILTAQVGNENKHSECELKTSLHDVVYSIQDGHLVTYTRSQFQQMRSTQKTLQSEIHPADTNPAHYVLSVTILEAKWDKNPTGGSAGSGRGNIRLGGAYAAFDFVALCPAPLGVTTAGTSYNGRWEEQPTRLIVLGHTPGDNSPSSYHACELKTDYRPTHVYIRNGQTGVVTALTQDEFKAFVEKRKAAQASAAQKTDSAATPSGSAAPVAVSAKATAPNKLTNSDVVSMVGAGLSSDVIVGKMNASDCAFDTSTDGLKQLKAARVPDAIVLEMIKRSK